MTDIKLVTNADSGTADIVGGDDWDAMATKVNSYSLGIVPAKYLVVKSGSTYYVKNSGGETAHSGSNPVTEIQWACDNLTASRTWKEKVLVMGDYSIAATILLPSYTIFELRGRMKLANATNLPILKNNAQSPVDAEKNTDIEIIGGEYDGNKANQTGGFLIHMSTAKNVKFRDVYAHDGKLDGISLQGCYNAEVNNCRLMNNGACGLRATSNTTNGVAGRDLRVIGCYTEGNAINGLWAQGASATWQYFNVTMVGNSCYNNTIGGLYIDWNVFGFSVVGNTSESNGQSAGSGGGGGIVINGQANGSPYYATGYGVVSSNSCYNNDENGIYICFAKNVKISNNTCSFSQWRGIQMNACKQCQIENNTCINNGQKTANTYEGIFVTELSGENTTDISIKYNTCFDDQGTKTQKYGIAVGGGGGGGSCHRNVIKYNNLKGNRTGSLLTTDFTDVWGNEGFRTKYGEYYGVSTAGSASGLWAGSTASLITVFGNTASVTRVMDSTGQKISYPTGATINTLTGSRTITCTERDLNPCLKVKFKLSQIDANTRIFIGLSSNAGANPTTLADPLANFSGFGLWYDGGVNANFRIYTNNAGANSTNTDTTVVADTVVHELIMFYDNSNARLLTLLDDVLVGGLITATPPAAGTDLGAVWFIENTAAASKTMDIWNVRLDHID